MASVRPVRRIADERDNDADDRDEAAAARDLAAQDRDDDATDRDRAASRRDDTARERDMIIREHLQMGSVRSTAAAARGRSPAKPRTAPARMPPGRPGTGRN